MTGTVSILPVGRQQGVEDQARAWLLRLAEEPQAQAECDAWRALDPAHDEAFREAAAVWDLAASLETAVDPAWRDEAEAVAATPASRLRDWALRGAGRAILPFAAAASLVAVIAVPRWLEPAPQVVGTAVAQTRMLALADGSRVTVGARSRVEASITGDERRVVLDDGQAFFEVAHDPARPFVVLAGNAEITVTGTKFDVHRVGDDVRVSVLEGRVELRRRPLIGLLRPAAPARVLVAGQSSDLDDGESFAPQQRATVTPGEWRSGRLYYSEAPLGEIVADMQRYSAVPIRVSDDRTAALRVTTSFRSNDVDGFVANVRSALPVESRREPDGSITLSSR